MKTVPLDFFVILEVLLVLLFYGLKNEGSYVKGLNRHFGLPLEIPILVKTTSNTFDRVLAVCKPSWRRESFVTLCIVLLIYCV